MKLFKTNTSPIKKSEKNSSILRNATIMSILEPQQKHLEHFAEIDRLDNNILSIVEKRTKELNELITRKNKFLSIIAHDLRSPFSSILATLELMKRKLDLFDKNDFETYLNIVQNSSINALELLDNLLTWTVLQKEGNSINPVKINLQKLFFDEIETLNESARQKQLTITHSIADDMHVTADLQMLKTILRNLISNAIKFSYPNELITVSALKNGQFVEISIKDNGKGISTDALEKLFKTDMIYSTEGTNHEKGTGLGLLICKQFIEMHEGEIHIDSQPEKGSTFKFTLPYKN